MPYWGERKPNSCYFKFEVYSLPLSANELASMFPPTCEVSKAVWAAFKTTGLICLKMVFSSRSRSPRSTLSLLTVAWMTLITGIKDRRWMWENKVPVCLRSGRHRRGAHAPSQIRPLTGQHAAAAAFYFEKSRQDFGLTGLTTYGAQSNIDFDNLVFA